MPSIVSDCEYDIFISYRHNDNRSGWVSEFVKALQEELAASIKESISVYFDVNPHDGLLETHSVNKSLEGKLKSLIFIPILSQTYCDPKSFAWQHEFCAFNALSKKDRFGRDVKLKGGNVASRILPVRIHDLEVEDKNLIQNELNEPLRAIDFIYRSPGVSRPLLRNEEDAKGNLDHTFYRDQINKLVRGIKDLITAMQTPTASVSTIPHRTYDFPKRTKKKLALLSAILLVVVGIGSFSAFYFLGLGKELAIAPDRSIAVLPFENMNKDPEQDYFSNGIAEDILNNLVKISDLKVKSRTSTLQYKGTTKTIKEIGGELSVGNIVEGSVRKVGDKVRIVVQLIDAKTDVHLWSETYDRDLKDILAVQSEIAMKIARALEVRLTSAERQNIQKEASQNATAYDYFLKAREGRGRANFDQRQMDVSMKLINKAIQLDPEFARAYALKARLWFQMGFFGVSQNIWMDSTIFYSSKASATDPALPDGYLVMGDMNRYLGKLNDSDQNIKKAYDLAPNDPQVLNSYGYQLLRTGDERGADMVLGSIENQFSMKDPQYYISLADAYYFAGDQAMQIQLLNQSKDLNPGAVGPYLNLAYLYDLSGQSEKSLAELKSAERINPNSSWIIDHLAWWYFRHQDYLSAIKYWSQYKEVEAAFEDKTQTVPFRHRLAMALSQVGKGREGEALLQEDLKIRQDLISGKRSMGTWGNFGSVYYDMAVDHALLKNNDLAVQCMDSAQHYRFYMAYGYEKDPAFAELKSQTNFKQVQGKVDKYVNFRQMAFSNAINRSKANKELKERNR